MTAHQHEGLAAESAADKDARLQQMTAHQLERLAAETRDTRLQQMRDRAETTDEGYARLECDRARHREQQTVQYVTGPSVSAVFHQAKMHQFHANIGYILASFPDSPLCPDNE